MNIKKKKNNDWWIKLKLGLLFDDFFIKTIIGMLSIFILVLVISMLPLVPLNVLLTFIVAVPLGLLVGHLLVEVLW